MSRTARPPPFCNFPRPAAKLQRSLPAGPACPSGHYFRPLAPPAVLPPQTPRPSSRATVIDPSPPHGPSSMSCPGEPCRRGTNSCPQPAKLRPTVVLMRTAQPEARAQPVLLTSFSRHLSPKTITPAGAGNSRPATLGFSAGLNTRIPVPRPNQTGPPARATPHLASERTRAVQHPPDFSRRVGQGNFTPSRPQNRA